MGGENNAVKGDSIFGKVLDILWQLRETDTADYNIPEDELTAIIGFLLKPENLKDIKSDMLKQDTLNQLEIIKDADSSVTKLALYDVINEWAKTLDFDNKKYQNASNYQFMKRFNLDKVDWDTLDFSDKFIISSSCVRGFDPDCALISVIVYLLAFNIFQINSPNDSTGKLWNIENKDDDEYELVPKIKYHLRGDTMNSYHTTLKAYAKLKDSGVFESFEPVFKWNNKDLLDNIKDYDDGKINQLRDDLRKFIKTHTNIKIFLRVNYTLGNFMPVPFIGQNSGQFNSPRGFGSSKDYWDLAMVCIYNFYNSDKKIKKNNKDVYTLNWLLQSNNKNEELCKKWLYSFGYGQNGWNNFIERNYLQDWVEDKEQGFGKPLELWDGHFEGDVEPKEKPQFEQFFKIASIRVIARSVRIAQELNKNLKAQINEKIELIDSVLVNTGCKSDDDKKSQLALKMLAADMVGLPYKEIKS